jgi:predicted hotdog family 3-hydroxylacyl-ACP dehydratase
MSAAAFPGLGELMPHAGPMRLLSRVVGHSPEATRCELEVAASALFLDDAGALPAFVALEWMAQCIAAHGGLVALAAGRRPPHGVLVGARQLSLARATFAPSDTLAVTARFLGASGALVAFACEVEERGSAVASGVLSVALVDAS